MTEEARAAEYRRVQQRVESLALARYRALAGDPVALAARLAATAPLRRDEGWDPTPLLTDKERAILGNS